MTKHEKICRYAAVSHTSLYCCNNCLEADDSNKIVESTALVKKTAKAITIMGKLNAKFTNDRKERY